MNEYVVASNLDELLLGRRRLPTTMMWNRLEGRPRTVDFSRALRAEVRDPLWLLTRQWQMGEFIGDDAASPVTATIAWRSEALTGLRDASGVPAAYDDTLPLEAMVEARPVELERAGHLHNADIRLALGRAWQDMLSRAGLDALFPDFRNAYRFVAHDREVEADYPVTTSAATWQFLAALAGRAMDGGALLVHLREPGKLASDGLGLTGTVKNDVDVLGEDFLAWAGKRYSEPDSDRPFWVPGRLEYRFGLTAPRGGAPSALGADEYHGGHLDWYHLDAMAAPADAAPGTLQPLTASTFFPMQAQFDGMPHTRHWAFEESAVNLGDIRPDTQDLSKLLLIEYGLIFGNDWFLLPLEIGTGTLTGIRGLAVTNVFGERTWIEPAVSAGGPVGSWRMFQLTGRGASDDRLFLPPSTAAPTESGPVEAVDFVRDEVSNMVWGVERMVQLPDGISRRGRELGDALLARYQQESGEAEMPSANDARIAYRLMTSVPENWIPFLPVHVEGDNREIQLQRGAMPRLLDGDEGVAPARIRPRTALLLEGHSVGGIAHYFIAEEEIERVGTVVETRWQRCRAADGRVVLWLGHQRSTGRAESSSGLAFDIVLPKAPAAG